jgi:hypothetical protein
MLQCSKQDKTKIPKSRFWTLEFWKLEFVSDFDIRISDLSAGRMQGSLTSENSLRTSAAKLLWWEVDPLGLAHLLIPGNASVGDSSGIASVESQGTT